MACRRGSVHNCACSRRGQEAIWRQTATVSIPMIRDLIPEQALMMDGLRFLQAARARGLESLFLRTWRLLGSVLKLLDRFSALAFRTCCLGLNRQSGLVAGPASVPTLKL